MQYDSLEIRIVENEFAHTDHANAVFQHSPNFPLIKQNNVPLRN